MEDMPDTRTQLSLMLLALRDSVLPPLLGKCIEAIPKPPGLAPRSMAMALLARTKEMRNDADLRYWLFEHATIGEAVTVVQAFEVVLAAVHQAAGEDERAILNHVGKMILSTPQLLTVVRHGLGLIEKSSPTP